MALTNSTVRLNSVGITGDFTNGGIMTLTNTTVSNNVASHAVFNDIVLFGFGGGIYNGDTMTLTNSTVIDNIADINGGGILNGGTLTLTNSTVNLNSAANGGGIYSSFGTNNTHQQHGERERRCGQWRWHLRHFQQLGEIYLTPRLRKTWLLSRSAWGGWRRVCGGRRHFHLP